MEINQIDERQQNINRWRLILGAQNTDGAGVGSALSSDEEAMERTLAALYDGDRQAGLGGSAPNVARWLGDIRKFFPKSVVTMMQKDALSRLNLKQMLSQPEFLEQVEPDVHLVANLLSLSRVLPEKTKETARFVVKKVVDALIDKLTYPLTSAVRGALSRSIRNRRPHYNEMDWLRTIRINLKHYLPERKTIIAEKRIGYGRKQTSLKDVILCVDQSGSMASSVVYAGIFGAVLASMPALRTRVVVFDTSVVDLTEHVADPVELLFGTQLGGGTDINRALAYCQTLVQKPDDTILVLITDLFEGGDGVDMIRRVRQITTEGVQLITLLALSDDGAPGYNHAVAAEFAELGVPAFGCTPEQFPDLMAAAIQKQDMQQWAAAQGIVVKR